MKTITLILLLFTFTLSVMAQRTKSVEATYVYLAPENITPEQAKRTALERAKIQAIADEFGTNVSQTNISNVSNENGQSSIDFQSIGLSEVKGEWLEDTAQPQYNLSFEQGTLIVRCTVSGNVREIVTSTIDCDIHLLRNGKQRRFESNSFVSEDQMYLTFQSPVDGFLAVYLLDTEETAYCLLPYPQQNGMAYPIKANQHYLLFDRDTAAPDEEPLVEEYHLTCQQSVEHNQLYVVFSPNTFAKALDNQKSNQLPSELREDDFQRWLAKCRRQDKEMQLRRIPITIKQSF